MQATDGAAWTLVQPTGRRREWELRDGDGPLARLRIPTFRSGAEAEIGNRRLRIQRRNDQAAAAAGGAVVATTSG
jgi:hypothetical protein